jgi:hypothetical protein
VEAGIRTKQKKGEGGNDRKGGRKRIRQEKRMKGVSWNEGKQTRELQSKKE